MPSSNTLFTDMDRNGVGLEDQRALQLALELSMLDCDNDNECRQNLLEINFREKKGQNMTECVPVPTSEHVAEIVGRQGCKIKALRAKTNTYIKTPVRGEEPVFIVTGRKEDVALAKQEILSATDHFSQIRASRKSNMNGFLAPGPPGNIPGQTTIQVRVPYRVVGLVVGPKGATIKRIQHQTHTYIVTPSREKEPVFEVTGLPENVDIARREIESHIALRTGLQNPSVDQNDFHRNGIDQTFPDTNENDYISMYKSDLSGLNSFNSAISSSDTSVISPRSNSDNMFPFPNISCSNKFSEYSKPFVNGLSLYDPVENRNSDSPLMALQTQTSLWPDIRANMLPFGSVSNNTVNGSVNSFLRRSSFIGEQSITSRLSPTLSNINHSTTGLKQGNLISGLTLHPTTTLANLGSLGSVEYTIANSEINDLSSSAGENGISTPADSVSRSPTDSVGSMECKVKRDCVVCYESDIVAALVPCGHNLFCLECANRVCDKVDPQCPICHQPVLQAIRIYS